MSCGIYKIINKVNGKVYIGKSVDVEGRWNQHKNRLRNDNGKPNSHLQNAWKKYGEESFEYFIIEECKIEELKEREEYWINKLESWNCRKGYNIIRISKGLNVYPKETRQKMSESKKGKHHTKETRQKMSESKKGKYCGENNPNFGKRGENHHLYGKENKWGHHSEESKRKIGKRNKGRIYSIEEREKLYIGENNPRAKLTLEQVKEIKTKYIPRKYTIKMLAKEYNVSKRCIQKILYNQTWKEK